MLGRIPILDLAPQQPDDLWPAKAFEGEVVPFSATVFKEGHDVIDAAVVLTAPSGRVVRRPMVQVNPGLGRWTASVQVDETGPWAWHVDAWLDDWGTWLHDAGIKIPAGIDVDLMFEEGARLLERAAEEDSRGEDAPALLRDTAGALRDGGTDAGTRWGIVTEGRVADVHRARSDREPRDLRADAARCASSARAPPWAWYKFFPRSEGAKQAKDGSWTGNLPHRRQASARVAEMGFDVVYLPPIHPIGQTYRKGPNNTLDRGPGRPGQPLGDRLERGRPRRHPPRPRHLRRTSTTSSRRRRTGLEVAIDLALQCSPDHPWVTEHPEWFTHARRRLDRLRREPAEEVPGHLPGQLRQRPGGHLRRGAAGRPVLDRPRHHDLPGRQPAHQAARLLGVADRRRQRAIPGRRCSSPRRSPGRR